MHNEVKWMNAIRNVGNVKTKTKTKTKTLPFKTKTKTNFLVLEVPRYQV